MARRFQFALRGSRQRLWTRNDGKKNEDRVWVVEHLKRADIRIIVPDDAADFDLDKLRKNENTEWMEYENEIFDYVVRGEEVDCDDEKVCAHYQEILADGGVGDVEDALSEDGFSETDDDDIFNDDELDDFEEITS